jgi:hypothetical protein
LANPSAAGGWVVQEIAETSSAGAAVAHYWEAWQMVPGSTLTTQSAVANYDDRFQGGPRGDVIQASARFYEGYRLSVPPFMLNNPATFAGTLFSTAVNPNIPMTNATPAVNRTWVVP